MRFHFRPTKPDLEDCQVLVPAQFSQWSWYIESLCNSERKESQRFHKNRNPTWGRSPTQPRGGRLLKQSFPEARTISRKPGRQVSPYPLRYSGGDLFFFFPQFPDSYPWETFVPCGFSSDLGVSSGLSATIMKKAPSEGAASARSPRTPAPWFSAQPGALTSTRPPSARRGFKTLGRNMLTAARQGIV